jgi:peptidoglycan/LPS O-acetylase OafA/YrhL
VTRRLAWIDGLRGVAALLVLGQHALERLAPGFRAWTGENLQLGQLGVTVFFLISGLVVPASLERAGALRSFWTARFFRLWPAYWLSIAGVALVHLAGVHPYPREVRSDVSGTYAANATMIQAYLGKPDLLGVYWTLAFELAFYVALTALWALGVVRRSVLIAVVACVGTVAVVAIGRATGHHVPLGLANLATMFVGTVLWHWREGTVSARVAWSVVALGAVSAQVVLAIQLAGRGVDRSTADQAGWRSFALAWLVAYAVVSLAAVAAARDAISWPGWLVRVGAWSYALYLFHPVVFDALHDAPGPWPILALQWCAAAVVVAGLVHVLVERPAIALGRRLTPQRTRV